MKTKEIMKAIFEAGYKRRFASLDAYYKEYPVEGVDFVWTDKNGYEFSTIEMVIIDLAFKAL